MGQELAGVVAIIGMIAGAVGTVVGSKVAVTLLQRAHERFEDSVWKAINGSQVKVASVSERLAAVEAVCEIKKKEGVC